MGDHVRKIAMLALVATLLSSAASAQDVRHRNWPGAVRGTWATSAELCKGSGNSRIVVSARQYSGPQGNCRVDWVEELPAAQGPIYSGHSRCGTPARTMNLILWPKGAGVVAIGPDFDHLNTYRRCR
jgi:hypothetical protein